MHSPREASRGGVLLIRAIGDRAGRTPAGTVEKADTEPCPQRRSPIACAVPAASQLFLL